MPESIARDVVTLAGLAPGSRILEVGAGTGRVCLTLAAQGFRVVGVEPARAMLDVLGSKDPQKTVRVAVAEGARLPFADSCFDAVVLARLLYLLPDWREVLAEVLRVVRPDGRVLHEWGNGATEEPWVQIREEARRLFEAAGVRAPFHPGVRSEAEVDGFLAGRGCKRLGVIRSPGESTLPLSTFLERIVNGECSYTWDVPDDVLEQCLPQLEAWATARFDLARTEPIPRETQWAIHQVES